MVVKLDLANAFDRVRHKFLLKVLHKLGFGEKFINWIRACISEPWIAPLVNGRAVDFFKATRGLRQGCPLSPLLFVLQASVLNFYLDKKRADQDIVGLCIARGVKNINHALFADDTLLLGASSVLMASRFKRALDEFCIVSGSSLNNGKFHIYNRNTTSSLLNSIPKPLVSPQPQIGHPSSQSWKSWCWRRHIESRWHKDTQFHLGFGTASSIQAKTLALFQRLKILKVLNIREASVIGDSQVIINTMVSHSKPKDLRLARLIFRIIDLGDSFQNLNFYHVLRANNKETDIEANKAALLMAGALLRGG
eukprot:PITA_11719